MPLNDTKPAVQSVGILANSAGSLISLGTIALATFGHLDPTLLNICIVSAATLASNLLGLFGRAKAKAAIDGVFFAK